MAIGNHDGIRSLEIFTIDKYFETYKLCVKAPDGTKKCDRFRMEKSGENYTGSVRWSEHFPNKGAGAYTAIWTANSGEFKMRAGWHKKN